MAKGKREKPVRVKGVAAVDAAAPNKRQERQERLQRRRQREKEKFSSHLTDEQDRQFAEQLRRLGCHIRVIVGDGNCMFRSLSDQVTGNQNDHAAIRSRIVSYIEERREFFSLFIEDDEPFDDYVQRMRQDAEWGGHQELFAASQLFDAHVIVHQLRAPRLEILYDEQLKNGSSSRNSSPKPRALHLSYHGEQHYNSVRALDDDTSHPPKPILLATAAAAAATAASGTGSGRSSGEERREYSEAFSLVSQSCPWVSAAEAAATLERAGGVAEEAVELLVAGVDVLAEEVQQGQPATAAAAPAAAADDDNRVEALAGEAQQEGEGPASAGEASGSAAGAQDGTAMLEEGSSLGAAVEEAVSLPAPSKAARKRDATAKKGAGGGVKVKRKAECPCGSGRKYRDCCRKKGLYKEGGGGPTEAAAAQGPNDGKSITDAFGALAI